MRLRPQQTPFKFSLGERGEIIAWDYLIKNGYKILEKNYRCKIGEVDGVAQKSGRLIFVEVKTRKSSRYGPPEEAVHIMKQKKILKIAQWYIKEKKILNKPVSFAVVAIDWNADGSPEIRFVSDAFNADILES